MRKEGESAMLVHHLCAVTERANGWRSNSKSKFSSAALCVPDVSSTLQVASAHGSILHSTDLKLRKVCGLQEHLLAVQHSLAVFYSLGAFIPRRESHAGGSLQIADFINCTHFPCAVL